LPLFIDIAYLYTNQMTIDLDKGDLPGIQRHLNVLLTKYNDPNTTMTVFHNLSSRYPVNDFAPCKGYLVYNCYQLKSYSNIKAILDNFYICLHSDDYDDFVDFLTMNYFKGLIFLSCLVRY
jgi:hypothetical protein